MLPVLNSWISNHPLARYDLQLSVSVKYYRIPISTVINSFTLRVLRPLQPKKVAINAEFQLEAAFPPLRGKRKTIVDDFTKFLQVAQLSQRDRAAGWDSNGQKWKTGTERQYLRTI